MGTNNKTTELASLIKLQFEQSRLQSERIDPALGRHKFIIEITDSNLISIQVPEVIQVDNYTEQIFSIVDSIINEAGYQVTKTIEIKIYGPDRMQLDDRKFHPPSKLNVSIHEVRFDMIIKGKEGFGELTRFTIDMNKDDKDDIIPPTDTK
jgi:hypothetical protein